MSEEVNPFDLGPNANPVDVLAFNAARDAWYADKERIEQYVLPEVDRAIAKVNDWTEVINNIIGLIEQVLPIISVMAGPVAASATTSLSTTKGNCGELCQLLTKFQTNASIVTGNLPGLFDKVNELLKK